MNGHSLGTGVSCSLAKALKDRSVRPHGYLLLAPFNNIEEEVTKGFKWSAYFGSFLVNVPALIK